MQKLKFIEIHLFHALSIMATKYTPTAYCSFFFRLYPIIYFFCLSEKHTATSEFYLRTFCLKSKYFKILKNYNKKKKHTYFLLELLYICMEKKRWEKQKINEIVFGII